MHSANLSAAATGIELAVAVAPQTHLTGHSEGENALLDATVDVLGAVYGFALNVVAGQELERGRGGVSQT